ncbi:MAG: phage tail tape measure protein [Myxococcales bacterium]|nr:phage tail tape measure protein [Myxococcales bacterium]
MNNDLNLKLGLDTSPATSSWAKYTREVTQSAKKQAAAQRPVGTALARLVKAARKAGVEYNSATKIFKDGSTGAALSIKEVSARIKELNGDLDKTKGVAQNALGGIGAGFKQVLQGIPQGIGLAIGQQLIAPLTNFGTVLKSAVTDTVKTYVDIDAALRQTASISGATKGQFEELQNSVIGLAKDTKFTTGELAEASIALARAGFDAQEVQQALPGISEGAAAAGQTMEQMSDTVIGAMGGFQIGTEGTIGVVDVLTQAANNSNQTVTDLGDALKYAGPVAKGLGLTLEDTSAVLGLLANAGIRGSQAGTTLRTGLSRLAAAAAGNNSEFADLSRGTGRLAKTMEMLGADITDAEGELKAFPELLKTLKAGLGGLSSTEQQLVSKILFGDEAASGFRALLNSSVEDIEEFAAKTNNATGVAAETSQKNLEGIAGSLTFLSSAFDAASATVGKFLGTFIKPLIDALAAVLNAFNGLPTPVQNVVVGVTALAVAAGLATAALVLFNAASNAGIFATLANSIAGTVASFGIYATTLKTQVVGGLAAAGAAAVSFSALLTKKIVVTNAATAAIERKTAALVKLKLVEATGVPVTGAATAAATAQATAQTGVATSATAAAGGMGAFMAAAGPIAILAVGVLAVAAAWDTYAQVAKGAEEAGDALGAGNKELKDQLRALGAVVEETNKEAWERSADSVGGFRAGLDRLIRASNTLTGPLQLNTAEAAKFNATSNELAEGLGRTIANLDAGKEAYDNQVKRLGTLTKGSKEYNLLAREIDKTEKVLTKTFDEKIKALEDLKKKLKARNAESEREKQAQFMAIANTENNIRVLKEHKKALDLATEGYKNLHPEIAETGGALKALDDRLKEASDAFKGQMKAMEESFKNLKKEMAEGLKDEVDAIKTEIKSLKDESKVFTGIKNDEIRAIKEIGTEQQRTNQDAKASIKEVSEAKIASINKANNVQQAAFSAEISGLEKAGAAAEARHQRAASAAQSAHDRVMKHLDDELKAIEKQKKAVSERYDAALDGLRAQTPAEKALAFLERAKLEQAAQLGGEEGLRAKAQLERLDREEQIALVQKAKDAELAVLDAKAEAKEEEKRKKEEDHINRMRDLEIKRAADAAKNEEDIAELRAAAALKEEENAETIKGIEADASANTKRLEDEIQQQKRDNADEIKKLEDDKRADKEVTAKKEAELLGTIEKLEDDALTKKEAAEEAYNNRRNEMLEDFNTAIGNTTDVIIREGDTAWSTYASNAVTQLGRVQRAAEAAAKAAKAAGAGQPNRWTGGPVSAGQRYTVNELGQEAFRSSTGKLSLIDAPAFGKWRAPSKGTVINAAQTERLMLPSSGPAISGGPAIDASGGVAAQRANGSETRNLLRAIARATGGDNITNNVTIQSANTTQTASDMMVELTKVKRRRLR